MFDESEQANYKAHVSKTFSYHIIGLWSVIAELQAVPAKGGGGGAPLIRDLQCLCGLTSSVSVCCRKPAGLLEGRRRTRAEAA